jgi:hypothetical protein
MISVEFIASSMEIIISSCFNNRSNIIKELQTIRLER